MHDARTKPSLTQVICLIIVSSLCLTTHLAAQDDGGVAVIGPTFTYQGVLKQSGTPINGLCDLQFSLWNAPTGSSQIGTTQQFLNASFSNGLVTTDLNFGAGAFDGNDRWIQIAVRFPAGSGGFTTLTPRQKINAAPYALWALSGGSGGGLTLPYSAVVLENNAPLFQVTNTGLNGAIQGFGGTFGVQGLGYGTPGAGVLGNYFNGNYGKVGTADYGIEGVAVSGAGVHGQHSNGHHGYLGLSDASVLSVDAGLGSVVKLNSSYINEEFYEYPMAVYASVPFPNSDSLAGKFIGTVRFLNNDGEAGIAGGIIALKSLRPSGLFVNFRDANGITIGSITFTDDEVYYNGFTGSHFALVDQPVERAALVSLTGKNEHVGDNPNAEIIYGIRPSTIANDSKCMGSYLGPQDPTKPTGKGNPHLVMAVGNGDMWVAESSTGNIEPGGYLISSDVSGCAMKDDPHRFPMGYIIARASEAVDWAAVESPADGSPKRKNITVFFENFVRDSRGAELAKLVDQQNERIANLEAQIRSLLTATDRLSQLEKQTPAASHGTPSTHGGQQ